MNYQVLARKYRPRTFAELVGQEHVSKALTHALDQDRLHHAYLFTGTRGCGKTTIARILAKCLNCEQGVSSQPCGVCDSCQEIAEGRFVDLIEVDAASRTKVEDTRELLDNVQYAPTRGRYKVYLIDEVHMLSTHSFNALLKTLEEPPPHVKFLLATTDPQKLPVTILSRCLQFNLKGLPADRIASHLKLLLEREMIRFEDGALMQLGRAARGSMRDALSLADQAIAFSGEHLTESQVGSMLGTVDRAHVLVLLRALAEADPAALLAALDQVAEHSPDELSLLDELITMLHRLAVAQIVPQRESEASLTELAGAFQAEQLQLFYDVAVRGRRDLPEVPDARAGLEMILLRMLVFRPDGVIAGGPAPVKKPSEPAPVHSAPVLAAAPRPAPDSAPTAPPRSYAPGMPEQAPTPELAHGLAPEPKSELAPESAPAPTSEREPESPPEPSQPMPSLSEQLAASQRPAATSGDATPQSALKAGESSRPEPRPESRFEPEPPAPATPAHTASAEAAPARPAPAATAQPDERELADPAAWWASLVERLPVEGVVRNLARNCVLVSRSEGRWQLAMRAGYEVLAGRERLQALEEGLGSYLGHSVSVSLQVDDTASDTPDELAARRRQQQLDQAKAALSEDATVRLLLETFNGRLDEHSIEPPETEGH
ncbi:DNA polymerase III subunit gamma/tau [Alcanivorax quisquiliarum]|uniref:DNA polymerase III subunit gamma/tau n=1 Tax=Alcanivorax quisquiliarum TaxID=2933565 RepID=A0ABT0E4F2_9GAMM|nr:DNA polymerase III subunit gamma/tau [Alcanivorax quisquiliarum]MCK0536643.1 DNA polymerase III subunit gamma/tau [Alcanivorax quisquiliarum]